MAGKNKLMTVSEYAAHAQVHKSTISRQVRDGIIPIAGKNAKGHPLIDPKQADDARDSNLNPLKARNVAPADERVKDLLDGVETDDLDEDETEEEAGERRSPGQSGKSDKSGQPSRQGALTQAAAADKGLAAMQRRVQLARELAELVPAQDVDAMFQTMGTIFRARLMSLPVKLSSVVVAETLKGGRDPELRAVLEREFEAFLLDVSREFDAELADGGHSPAAGAVAVDEAGAFGLAAGEASPQ